MVVASSSTDGSQGEAHRARRGSHPRWQGAAATASVAALAVVDGFQYISIYVWRSTHEWGGGSVHVGWSTMVAARVHVYPHMVAAPSSSLRMSGGCNCRTVWVVELVRQERLVWSLRHAFIHRAGRPLGQARAGPSLTRRSRTWALTCGGVLARVFMAWRVSSGRPYAARVGRC